MVDLVPRDIGRTKVLILSWERPLYLWASLDSLYRNTKIDVDFILLDNNSQDPLVAEIIRAFNRRGMFSEIAMSPTNDPANIKNMLKKLRPTLGRYVGIVESDVVIQPGQKCWVQTMLEIMEQRPRLAMLGSQCDKSEFIDVEHVSRQLNAPIDDKLAQLLKAHSPERTSYSPPGTLGEPHNPPGRLLMLRTAAVDEVGLAPDGELYRRLKDKGYEALITGDVVHRHLSLLNYYDYPEYDVIARVDFMTRASLPLDTSGEGRGLASSVDVIRAGDRKPEPT
jgi:hypothetical protein